VRVKGGGHTSQIYAIRQAIAKALVAYYAKYFDAQSAITLKKELVAYDRSLLIADPRRMEPKKFGGGGARARRQKRYGGILLLDHILTPPQLSLIYVFFDSIPSMLYTSLHVVYGSTIKITNAFHLTSISQKLHRRFRCELVGMWFAA
jgi:hypothetical protein